MLQRLNITDMEAFKRLDASETAISDAEARAIRERCSRATPGPWIVLGQRGVLVWSNHRGGPPTAHSFVCTTSCEGFGDPLGRKDDAEFIAHARDDVERLLADRDRLIGLVREVRAQLEASGNGAKVVDRVRNGRYPRPARASAVDRLG